MDKKRLPYLIKNSFLFWLSQKTNYPFIPPDTLQLCFTFRCNIRCRMCSMHEKAEELKSKGKPYELSAELMKDLISQAYDMKINEVYFVGGEPFIEKEIFNLIKYASSLGMRTVVNTNGLLLDSGNISNIFDSGLSCVTFSIDGPDRETYENIRGHNIFEKVSGNLSSLLSQRRDRKAPGPAVNILCTIMKQNIGKLPEMVNFTKGIGADSINFQPVVPDNTNQSRDIASDTWVSQDVYDRLDKGIGELIKLKKDIRMENFITNPLWQLELVKLYFRSKMANSKKCYIGLSRLIVTQDHRIYFCAPDPLTGDVSFGDVSSVSLRSLWRSREAAEFRKRIKRCQRPCLLSCSSRPEFDELRGMMKAAKKHYKFDH